MLINTEPKMPRPPGVPAALIEELRTAVAGVKPGLTEAELAETRKGNGASLSTVVQLPTKLVMRHVEQRMLASASESEISDELDYLLQVVRCAAKQQ